MRACIEHHGSRTPQGTLARWGERASEEDLLAAATDLLAEQDDGRLLSYLRLFQRRPSPLDPGRLIVLSAVDDDEAAWVALQALVPIRHPEVRARALTLLSHPLFASAAIGILSSNFESGDERIVERTLEAPRQDQSVSHSLGLWARHFIDAHPKESSRILHLVYETTPCSTCRESAVAMMAEAGRLPVRLREECRWDASAETRRLAAKGD